MKGVERPLLQLLPLPRPVRRKIFISYRRADGAGYARALYGRLRRSFAAEDLFMDVDAIPPGDAFPDVIRQRIDAADVVLVLIGRQWSAEGRLHDPADWVRQEVERALAKERRVIPVLLDGAALPAARDLPASLVPLLRRNAVELTNAHFDAQADRLVRALRGGLHDPVGLLAGAGAVAAAGGAVALTVAAPQAAGFPVWLAAAAGLAAAGLALALRRLQPYASSGGGLALQVLAPLLLAGTLLAAGFFGRARLAPATVDLLFEVVPPAGTGEAVDDGEVVLFVEGRPQTQRLRADGTVLFNGLPRRVLDDSVRAAARVPGFEHRTYTFAGGADAPVRTIRLVPLAYQTRLRGRVVDAGGRPAPGVLLDFDGGTASAVSDGEGRFEVVLPVKPGTVLPVRATRDGRVGYHDLVTAAAQTPIRITFDAGMGQ